MTDPAEDRRAELLAAALADELTAAERAELDVLRGADPTIDAELAELRALTGRLGAIGGWREPDPVAEPLAPPVPFRRRRPIALLAAAAAACLLLGGVGGALLTAPRDAHVAGPPGTLGAIEPVVFAGQPAGVDIDAALVAHTWGTETVLTIDGLAPGAAFSVVVVGEDGAEVGSGTLLGSSVPIECRLNAALLREDVAAVEIRDEDGAAIAAAAVTRL